MSEKYKVEIRYFIYSVTHEGLLKQLYDSWRASIFNNISGYESMEAACKAIEDQQNKSYIYSDLVILPRAITESEEII